MNINDIARLSGVSKATVSRVLNGINVRDESKQRVEKVIAETGFKPNMMARGILSKKTNLIGMILPTIKANVYSHLTEGITKILEEKGYSLILSCTGSKQSVEQDIKAFDFMKDRYVDGLIYVPQIPSPHISHYLKDYPLPMITIGEKVIDLDCPAVLYDDYGCAKAAVKHLLSLGHRRIAYIGPSSKFPSMGRLRQKGYCDALLEKGIEVKEEMIIETGFSYDDGYASARVLHSLPSPPTAIFTALDRLSIGAMAFFNKAGVRIPQEISLFSVDNDDVSSFITPPLSSVHFGYEETGERCAQLLFNLIEGKESPEKEILIPFKLNHRASVI